MKRYKYYQPNAKDLKDKQGDCAIRALTKFYEIAWLEAFDMLVGYARESQTTINSLTNIKTLFENSNVPYTSVYKQKSKNKETVLSFSKKHPKGRYTLYVRVGYGTHLVTVVDGIYYDTWDCGERYVYGYWSKD